MERGARRARREEQIVSACSACSAFNVVLWLKPRPTGPVWEELRDEERVEAIRDTLRVRELLRVVSALDATGCEPVVFKGAALALTHYEESWRRPRLDRRPIIGAIVGTGGSANSLRLCG